MAVKVRNKEYAAARSTGAFRTRVVRNRKRDLPRKAKHKSAGQ